MNQLPGLPISSRWIDSVLQGSLFELPLDYSETSPQLYRSRQIYTRNYFHFPSHFSLILDSEIKTFGGFLVKPNWYYHQNSGNYTSRTV